MIYSNTIANKRKKDKIEEFIVHSRKCQHFDRKQTDKTAIPFFILQSSKKCIISHKQKAQY